MSLRILKKQFANERFSPRLGRRNANEKGQRAAAAAEMIFSSLECILKGHNMQMFNLKV